MCRTAAGLCTNEKGHEAWSRDGVYNYGDFCWVDFDEMEGLNELPGQILAELLYLGHVKELS